MRRPSHVQRRCSCIRMLATHYQSWNSGCALLARDHRQRDRHRSANASATCKIDAGATIERTLVCHATKMGNQPWQMRRNACVSRLLAHRTDATTKRCGSLPDGRTPSPAVLWPCRSTSRLPSRNAGSQRAPAQRSARRLGLQPRPGRCFDSSCAHLSSANSCCCRRARPSRKPA